MIQTQSIELPERYADPTQQLVRVRSIRGLLMFAKLLRGPGYTERLLADLKIHEEFLGDPEGFTSPLLGDDILTRMSQEGFGEAEIRQMGATTLITNFPTALGALFGSMNTPMQLYQEMHEVHIHRFDRIWTYRLLHLDADGCSVEVRVRDDAKDIFKSHKPGSRRMCVFRQGIYMSLIGNIQKRFARLTESECMYLGDSRCVHHLDWGC